MTCKEVLKHCRSLNFAELSVVELEIYNERVKRMRRNPVKAQREMAEHDRMNPKSLLRLRSLSLG